MMTEDAQLVHQLLNRLFQELVIGRDDQHGQRSVDLGSSGVRASEAMGG